MTTIAMAAISRLLILCGELVGAGVLTGVLLVRVTLDWVVVVVVVVCVEVVDVELVEVVVDVRLTV